MALAPQIADTPEAKEIAELIARSRAAQAQIADATQEQVDRWIKGMVWAVAKESTAEMIAQHTVDETQLGNYDGKYLKIFRKTRATLMDIIDDKSVGVIEEDPVRNLIKIVKPIGVIGALSPSTNPGSHPGDQGDLGGEGPQLDHHLPAPAREDHQQDHLRPDARCAGQDGRAGRSRDSASKFRRSKRPTK
jgi:hypothetical protein